ncbi:hypothetical protein K461DRAFT_317757 [Myriangium duriaei CBS 260.36]|uniref:Uncharacterized protein n=1 Tax=Myriangium duriaei CBS 260.36 TaxID=1168546 RepID=A0A9P4JET3_9PEZI|nr:hypothetical protein K461DRAFT_317757 [Myriangium duriaei CBS 260.36]
MQRLAAISSPVIKVLCRSQHPAYRSYNCKRALSLWHPPKFENEKLYHYANGSPERESLLRTLKQLKAQTPISIPLTINGSKIKTGELRRQQNPSRHSEIVAEYAAAGPEQVNSAVDAALAAKPANSHAMY